MAGASIGRRYGEITVAGVPLTLVFRRCYDAELAYQRMPAYRPKPAYQPEQASQPKPASQRKMDVHIGYPNARRDSKPGRALQILQARHPDRASRAGRG